jgi:hypothetical protein
MPMQTTRRPIPSGSGASLPPPIDHVRIGDTAGEYRFMRRGKYRAWAYVVVSFVFEICALSGETYALLKYTKAGHNPDAAVRPPCESSVKGEQRCPGRVRENVQCVMSGFVVRAGASRLVVPARAEPDIHLLPRAARAVAED